MPGKTKQIKQTTAIANALASLNITNESVNDVNSIIGDEVTNNEIVNKIDQKLEFENCSITNENDVGTIAAVRVATAMLNTDAALESAKLDLSSAVNVNMGGIPTVQDGEVTIESFGSENASELAAVSYKYNLAVTRQDDFAATIFPMYVGKAGAAGVEVDCEIDYVYSPFARANGRKFERNMLVKTYADLNGPFSQNSLKLVPVSNEENAKYLATSLVGAETTVKDSDGSTYKTAPLAFGVEVPIVEIGQSPATLASGHAQDTTILDSSVRINSLLLDIAGAGAMYASSYLSGATFTYTVQGVTEEISLNLVVPDLVINYGTLTATDTANPDIAGLDGLAGTHYGVYKLVLTGNGSTEDAAITVYGSALELVELRKVGGDIEEDAELVDKAKAIKLAGYTVDASITNEDINEMGLISTTTTATQIYAIRPMAPRAAQAPIKGLATDSDDINVKKLIRLTYFDLSLQAGNALLEIADFMRNNYSPTIGLQNKNTDGLGRHFVEPYFETVNLDLSSTVDSQRSSGRDEDIGAAIVTQIKQLVNRMVTNSNYGNAKAIVTNTSDTIDVVIATNADIATWLPTDIDLGSGKRVKVTYRRDKVGGMKNKIIVLFSNFDNIGNTIDPLSFGNTLYVPTPIGTGERTIGKSTTRVLVANPQATPVTHTYILGEINLTGLDIVTSTKITQNVSK